MFQKSIFLFLFLYFSVVFSIDRLIIFDDDPIYVSDEDSEDNLQAISLVQQYSSSYSFTANSLGFWFRPKAYQYSSDRRRLQESGDNHRILPPDPCAGLPPGQKKKKPECKTASTDDDDVEGSWANDDEPESDSWKYRFYTDTMLKDEGITGKKASETMTIDGMSLTLYNYTSAQLSLKAKDEFKKNFDKKKSLAIFEIMGADKTEKNADKNVLSLSYGANYFNIRTNENSFVVPFDEITNFFWMYIQIGVNYDATTAKVVNVQMTVFSAGTVLRATMAVNNFKKPFYNGILYNGVLFDSKFNDYHCDCFMSNYNWYLGAYYSDPIEMFNLKRKDLQRVYISYFSTSNTAQTMPNTNDKTYFTVKDPNIPAASFTLGSTKQVETIDPLYDPALMSITFTNKIQQAVFDPGYPLLQNDRIDFTVGFWLMFSNLTDTATIFANDGYATNQFIKVTALQIGPSASEPGAFLIKTSLCNGNIILKMTDIPISTRKIHYLMFLKTPKAFGISTCFRFPLIMNRLSFGSKLTLKAKKHQINYIHHGFCMGIAKMLQSGLTYANLKIMASKIQKLILGQGFIGSIKTFRFYHGSAFFSGSDGTYDCASCNLCHTTYPFHLANDTTLTKYLTPSLTESECLICDSNTWYSGTKCAKSTCGSGFKDFINITRDCENCGSNCKLSVCKDGIREGTEVCDDGLLAALSGCTDSCDGVKRGYTCQTTVLPSKKIKDACSTTCGDGIVAGTEECDVLNNVNAVGCQNCKLSPGYFCQDQTCTICKANCGICSSLTSCQTCSSSSFKEPQGNCVSACPSGFYGDSNRICQPCSDKNCASCNSLSCLSCKTGFNLLDSGSCTSSCPTKTFQSNGKCLSCKNANCLVCSDQTDKGCSKCSAGKYLSLGSCVDSCLNNQYLDSNVGVCLDCPINCQSCQKTGCLVCSTGFLLSGGNCVTKCQDGSVQVGNECKSCNVIYPNFNCTTCDSSGCLSCSATDFQTPDFRCSPACPTQYYSNQKKCSKCIDNCAICSNSSICQTCSAGFFLNKSKICVASCEKGYKGNTSSLACDSCLVSNCDDCTSDISNCNKCSNDYPYSNPITKKCLNNIPDGYYLTSPATNLLAPCNDSCLICSRASKCLKCKTGSLNDDGDCLATCPTGYFNNASTNTCQKCTIANCEQCDESRCVLCANGFFYNGNTCVQTKCGEYGFYYDTTLRTCARCADSNCAGCISDLNNCELCNVGFYVSKGTCVNTCPSSNGFQSSPGKIFFYPGQTQPIPVMIRSCSPCRDSNCIDCSGDSAVCNKCQAGLYQYNGGCANRTQYADGYYVMSENPPVLQKCIDIHCSKCLDKTGCCLSCLDGFFPDNCTCSSGCSDGFYMDSNGKCKNCPGESTICYFNSTSNSVVSKKCASGKYKLDWINPDTCDSCDPINPANIYSTSAHYYKYTKDSEDYCGICPTTCSRCDNPDTCTQCISNTYLYSSNRKISCVGVAPDGNYLNSTSGAYQACTDTRCGKCAAANQCSQCKGGYLYQNTCVNSCPNGYYLKVDTCQACATQNCQICSSDGSTCSLCAGSKVLQNNVCVDSCSNGYHLTGKSCAKCMAHCSKCSSGDDCSQCDAASGKFKYNRGNGAHSCESPASGYYVNSNTNTLEKCMTNCKDCQDGSSCLTPDVGFYYYSKTMQIYQSGCPNGAFLSTDGKNCQSCPSHCSVCGPDSVCSQCETGFILDFDKSCSQSCSQTYAEVSGVCYKCPENSKSCLLQIDPSTGAIVAQVINECQQGFYLKDGVQCVSNCPGVGYYLNGDSCHKCMANCDSCSDEMTCSKSADGFFLASDGGKCLTETECKGNGFFIESSTRSCKSCSISNCSQCSDLANCEKCTYPYLLSNVSGTWQCVSSCSPGFYSNSEKICTPCLVSSCLSCDSDPTLCDSCQTPNLLSFDGSVCSSSCPIGFVSDSTSTKCLKCGDHCSQCTNELSNLTCITPEQDYFLLSPSNEGIVSCPNGYFSDENNLCFACPPDCLACLSASLCLQCNTTAGLFLDPMSKTCVRPNLNPDIFADFKMGAMTNCLIANCKKCSSNKECDTCEANFYWYESSMACVSQCPKGFGKSVVTRDNLPDQNLCNACDDNNCLSCEFNQTKCQACAKNYSLIEGMGKCTNVCPIGFYNASENRCLQCGSNCVKCANFSYCQKCDVNSVIFEGKCIAFKKTPDNVTIQDYMGKCPLCLAENYPCPDPAYRVPNSQACKRCPLGCIRCNSQQCVECANGTFFKGGKCLKKCGDFNYLNETVNACYPCSCYCKKCTSYDNCQKCDNHFNINEEGFCEVEKGYFLKTKLSSNFNCCPPGTTFIEDKKECKRCPQRCVKCTTNGTCLQCDAHSTLNKTTFLCDQLKGNGTTNLNDINNTSNNSNITNISIIDFDSSFTQSDVLTDDTITFIDPSTIEFTSSIEDSTTLDQSISIIQTPTFATTTSPLIASSYESYTIMACPSGCSSCVNQTCTACFENFTYIETTGECLDPCPDGQFRDVISRLCDNCSFPCQTCKPTATKCTSCNSNFNFIAQNSTCYPNYSCGNGQYMDNTTYNCLSCSSHCEKCSDQLKCSQCSSGYEVVNGTGCHLCTDIPGIGKDCKEVCGDGLLFNPQTSGHHCDDGNNVNGDGCDSNCQVELGWVCQRNNSYTPDVCHDTSPFNLTFKLSPSNPEKVIIQPNPERRKLKFLSSDTLMEIINFTIPQLNYTVDYDYKIQIDNSSNQIVIKINYSETVQNIKMSLTFLKSHARILQSTAHSSSQTICDEFGIGIDSTYYDAPITSSLYPYKAYSNDTIQKTDTIAKSETATTIVFIVATGPLYLFQAFSMFWMMVDCIQISYFLQYLNVEYPINLEAFLKILQNANLNFLPNPFSSLTSDFHTTTNVPNQEAPKRFNDLGITSSFLVNAGSQMLLFSVVFFVFFIVLFGDLYCQKKKIAGKMMVYTKKLREGLEYGFMLRIFFMVYMQLCLGSMLQLRDPNVSTSYNTFSSILGYLCFLILLGMFLALMRVINTNDFTEEKNIKKFSILYEDYRKDTWMQRNYPVISVLKKFLIIGILVFLHDMPKLEILFSIIVSVMSFTVLLIARPFERRLTNFVMAVTELAFVAVYVLIGGIHFKDQEMVNEVKINPDVLAKQVTLAWVIIFILCGVFSLYFIVYFRQQALAIKDAWKFLKDFKVKYEEYLRNEKKRNRSDHHKLDRLSLWSAIFRGKSPTATLEEIQKKNEILDSTNIDPKKTIDEIDEKYVDMEKMQESSMSGYMKKSKASRSPTMESSPGGGQLDERMMTSGSIGNSNSDDRKNIVREIVRSIREKKLEESGRISLTEKKD